MPFDQSPRNSARNYERISAQREALFRINVSRQQLRCKFMDISEGGAGLSYDAMGAEAPIKAVGRLVLPGVFDANAQIRWASLGKMGVSFMDDGGTRAAPCVAIRKLLADQQSPKPNLEAAASAVSNDRAAMAPPHSRRREERFSIALPATMWLSNGDMRLNCKIVDISAVGAGLSYDTIVGALPVAGEGYLNAPSLGQVRIEIRWLSFGRMGVAFKGSAASREPFSRALRQLIAELTSNRASKL